MAYIEIETPDGVRQVRLDRPRMSVGRLSYNDVALPYSQISRQHAELRLIDGVWWIADLHSTNGLHIGAERVGERRLTDGEVIALAPDILLHFVAEENVTRANGAAAQTPANPSAGKAHRRPWLLDQGSSSDVRRPTAGPARQAPSASPVARPASAPVARPASTPTSTPAARAFGPRSPFADDEERYIPPGMASQPASQPAVFPPPTAPAPPRSPAGAASWPGAGSPGTPGGAMSGATASYGYRTDAGVNTGGQGFYDPYQRGAGSQAPALLHVCQTCGQLTAPDAVYCQSCHHPIAYECPNCRLSLLPIQDRCPRCQTPNPASVRRAHRNPSG